MSGLCECGCGKPTKMAKQSSTRFGYVKGMPMRFLPGHNFRVLDEAERIKQHARSWQPIAERFWAKVDKKGNCWIWNGARDPNGYGRINVGGRGKAVLAHRVAWELSRAPVTDGLCVLHRCDVPACVNPDHLFLGTQPDNVADMDVKGRRVSRPVFGEANNKTIHPSERIAEIRSLSVSGMSNPEIARKFGVSRTYIWAVTTGKARKRG